MPKSRIIVRRKKRGRPPTGKALPLVNFRAPEAMVKAVDKWAAAQSDKPDRSEALRRLVARGLGN
jgi:hypothetical protein